MLTESDKAMIVYFWQEKGDLTRWCAWEGKQQEIESEFPELIVATKNKQIAEKTIDAIVDKISNETEY